MAVIIALVVTIAMGWGLVYFVQELWPRLPPWLSMLVFIFIAVVVIGYPILELARWSDRYLERHNHGPSPHPRHEDDKRP